MNVTIKKNSGSVKNIIRGQHVVDGAGVKINRIIGSHTLEHIDPFVLLDEIKSDDPDDYRAGFPTQLHTGLQSGMSNVTRVSRGQFFRRRHHVVRRVHRHGDAEVLGFRRIDHPRGHHQFLGPLAADYARQVIKHRHIRDQADAPEHGTTRPGDARNEHAGG